MTAKHTRGPWTVEDREERILIWSDGAHEPIAELSTVADGADDDAAERWADEQRENADLLAAAPDLLAACLAIVAASERRPGAPSTNAIAVMVRAAIQKAGLKP